MSQFEVASPTSARKSGAFRGGLSQLVDRALLRVCAAMFRHSPSGHLHITLPSGRHASIGSSETGVKTSVVLRNYGVVWKSLRRGALGFAESYMAGDFETDDLRGVLQYYITNESALAPTSRNLFLRSSWLDKLVHRRRANTRSGSRRNIAAHYDLGNAFYSAWLDPEMTYSSGIYVNGNVSLEEAQAKKYQRILDALELAPGHSLLEIGCGWGRFAEIATAHAGSITGITISEQQFKEALIRIAEAGLQDRVNIRFEDYRSTEGQFDRIASIEMIEAVGEENWATYFRTIADRLKPGGIAVLQAITIRQDLYENYRRNPDFIQRYIFPGGMLPTAAAIQLHARNSGLVFEELETFGDSYARTLAAWRDRFHDAWPQIRTAGADERFRRMWEYYLTYCEVGFEHGLINVGLYRLRKQS